MTSFPQLVKPAQTRRGKGWSVVYRDTGRLLCSAVQSYYLKSQSGYHSRPLWRLGLATPTLAVEYHALLTCRQNHINVPEVLLFRQDGDVTELALRNVENALPLNEYLAGPASSADKLQVVERIAIEIGKLHHLGWIHGALGNEHLLVQPDGAVTLIDFEKARWWPWSRRKDITRFWRRTQCLDKEQAAAFSRIYKLYSKGLTDV
mgnify:CR=1 FL=1